MPWKEKTVETIREEFVKAVQSQTASKSSLCREYGISRVTGDKWLERYESGEPLTDRPHTPLRTPTKTPVEKEEQILEVRRAHPSWGAKKIRKTLEKQGVESLPCASTITAILKRNGYVSKSASQSATAFVRFQKEHCNEMWQTDFKGHFAMQNGQRCFPLTVLDDCSRFSLCIDAKENEQRSGVIHSFTRLFGTYGLPDSLLCDNGNPWGASQSTGYTLFEIWLMDNDILPIHGRIKHPQTQGKEERFHRTLKAEVNLIAIPDIVEAQRVFDEFRYCYNHDRPHEALNMGVPAEHYAVSNRQFSERVECWEYSVRHVKQTGYLTYNAHSYFLGEAFGGQTVGVRESSINGFINIYYRNFRVARIDADNRVFASRKIYRLEDG